MQFVKMQGLGNDFVVTRGPVPEDVDVPALVRQVCDRNFGVGGDGLIFVCPSAIADFQMRIFNPDGSEAEMCGNGLRCAVGFAVDERIVPVGALTVETLGGIMKPRVVSSAGPAKDVEVDLGAPRLLRRDIPAAGDSEARFVDEPIEVDGMTLRGTAVSLGNPHVVFFVEDVAAVPLERWGPFIEHLPVFPRKVNVHFAQVVAPDHLRMRAWERGVGPTMACGTGACAAVVAGALTGRAARDATVTLPGGDLRIWWGEDDHLHMRGPCVRVFAGTFPVSTLSLR